MESGNYTTGTLDMLTNLLTGCHENRIVNFFVYLDNIFKCIVGYLIIFFVHDSLTCEICTTNLLQNGKHKTLYCNNIKFAGCCCCCCCCC